MIGRQAMNFLTISGLLRYRSPSRNSSAMAVAPEAAIPWPIDWPGSVPALPLERKRQKHSSPPGKFLYCSPNPSPTPPPKQPKVSRLATAVFPLAAAARRNRTQPHLPGTNSMAPSGFSSDQMRATGSSSK